MKKGATFTEEHRKNLSISHKGQKAWNKGNITIKNCNRCLGQYTGKSGSMFCSVSCAKIGNKNCNGKHYNIGKKPSEETKKKIGDALRGANNYRWIEDRTKLVKRQERNDSAYKEWRKSVRDRDGWKCKIANSNCLGKVVAHHILPWAKFPELRYKTNNGITLCRFHHPRKRDEEMKLSPYFQSLVIDNRN